MTADKVREIRRRVAAGEQQSRLAVEYGMGRQGINDIVLRKNWAHVV